MTKLPSTAEKKPEGTVVVSHGPELLVEVDGQLVACRGRRRLGKTVCGDRVLLSNDQPPVLDAIEPRSNIFPRADRRGRQQIVAANLARVVIVVAPQPAPTRDLINRYLVACENLGLAAIVCVNKCDLIDPSSQNEWEQRQELYTSLGYPVVRVSTKCEPGISALAELLSSGPSILVGQSGAGKSSIINQLLPDLELKTQAISNATAKGRHTTTATTLYSRDQGGPIIDSPGVWEYGIWKMPWDDVVRGFPEFSEAAQQCRFANCQHLTEPGCGVQAAAASGLVAQSRVDSYQRIISTLEHMHPGS